MKITKNDNFRIVIEPSLWYKPSNPNYERDARNTCQGIIDNINRHVDDVNYIHVEHDTEIVCSDCGYTWEEDETGLPQCCTKAQNEFYESKKEKV